MMNKEFESIGVNGRQKTNKTNIEATTYTDPNIEKITGNEKLARTPPLEFSPS